MSTLYDVARLAGVSTATVSHVINESRNVTPETSARVRRAISQLNFVPNPMGRLLALRKNGYTDTTPARETALARAFTVKDKRHEETVRTGGGGDAPGRDALPNWREATTGAATGSTGNTARAILKIVRATQPVSRADLARRLGLYRSTVTEVVKPLLASGVLRETETEQPYVRRLGRPPVGLSLGDTGALFVGVNIGVRRSQVGAALIDGRLVGEESFDTPADPSAALARIRAAVERQCVNARGLTLSSIGVSVPGPTDVERTRLLFAPHLGWEDVAVAESLRGAAARVTGREVSVTVENDATAAGLYEARRRLREEDAGEWDDFVLVRAGTGIGVGLVLGGEVYRGTGADGGLLGEFGHMTIVAGGKPCVCGNRGCWERYASAASASALYTGDRAPIRGGRPPRFVEIVARAEAGELRARSTLERTGEYLGVGIGNVISGLGVTRVVLSGRVVYGWKFIEASLKEAVARTMAGRLSAWSVEPGKPTGAGLGGALEIVIEQHLTAVISDK